MADSSILGKKADDIIDNALGLKSKGLKYKHKVSCKKLSMPPPVPFDCRALLLELLDHVKSKWHRGQSTGSENWRWEKQREIDPRNKSWEIRLERLIVNATGDDWVNQVPMVSGLTPAGDKRRAIDLVHRCGNGCYEFIELKVDEGGGSPLLAAMEILQYGVLYIFSRENAQTLGYKRMNEGLLEAAGIHLKVLAPTTYYAGYDLSWLEKSIKVGLDDFLAQRKFGFKMDFEFATLSLNPSCSTVTWKKV